MSDDIGVSEGGRRETNLPGDLMELRTELERVGAERDRYRDDLEALRRDPLSVIQAKLTYLGDRINRVDRRIDRLPALLLTEMQAMQQLFQRFSPRATLPLIAGWALSPRGLLTLTDLIADTDAHLVLECGSGTSTLWMAYALQRKGGGKAIALDHLPEYADRTRAMIHAHGLDDFADVRLSPLVPRATPRGEFLWYDFDADSLAGPIEVLLVDGPPGDTGPHARYPALPVLVDHLAVGAHVLMDDVNRRDEREVLDIWLSEVPGLSRLVPPGMGLELLTVTGCHRRD
ncbi:class I SAM-dependent methyltransferase [Microbacterium lacticum]